MDLPFCFLGIWDKGLSKMLVAWKEGEHRGEEEERCGEGEVEILLIEKLFYVRLRLWCTLRDLNFKIGF